MHNEIKSYELETLDGRSSEFVVKKIEDIYDLQNGIEDAPHRHKYYTLIVVKEGEGWHVIDFNEFAINNHSLHFVYPGQVHQVSTKTRPAGWVINFSAEFVLQNGISSELINRVYLFNTSGYSPPLNITSAEFQMFENLMLQIISYQDKVLSYQYEAFGALLKLFFINVTSLCSVQKTTDIDQATGSNSLFFQFKQLIEKDFKTCHKVSDYANQLSVSSEHLNRYVKLQSGKSAKEFIQEKIIVEAKRMLLFTEESNKELAYSLGFEEPAHFSNFFKKYVGLTPGQFRTDNR